ncbi:MAG: CPBP family intramembrane metalloprotease [Bacteroidetes bacterium]|nr:CPBP family intramembrane metalloprotease [Bacteroidota bacterium]
MDKIITSKTFAFFATLIIMLLVTMTLFLPIANIEKLVIRILFIVCFFISWKLFQKRGFTNAKNLAFAFMALNFAFLVVSFFTSSFWNLDQETSKGFALIKLSDAVIISLVLILFFKWGGYKLKNIYLTKGRLIPGLITGILLFIVFGYLAIKNPQQPFDPGFLRNNYVWILIFVFANGFMEELIFRGIFLKTLIRYMKPVWAIVITSICFAAPHLTVNYAPDVLIFAGIVFLLGMICSFAMYYTRSLIAPMLIHAGADLMIIIQVFASYEVIR